MACTQSETRHACNQSPFTEYFAVQDPTKREVRSKVTEKETQHHGRKTQ
jgi:hypothetical protein